MSKYTCFSRYLAAKKTVDDRALNRYVWQTLAAHLPQRSLRILEVGAGIGTMIERVLKWGLFANEVDYTAIDIDPTNLQVMQHRLGKIGFVVDGVEMVRGDVRVRGVSADIHTFLAQTQQHYDLIIAHAFLDLVDLPTILPLLLARSAGLYYFTINFDGITAFQPPLENDAAIETAYHQTMDNRIVAGKPSGDRHSGRHLLWNLRQCNTQILAAGSSDWIVFADKDGNYPHDEAYFLHFIIDTIGQALTPMPNIDEWTAQRHQHIEQGDLIYLAHQLDVVGKSSILP